MPRVARNIVEFVVDNISMRAVFSHCHAKESDEYVDIPVYDDIPTGGGVLGSQEMERVLVGFKQDYKVIEPITELYRDEYGKARQRKLRHLTTCSLQVANTEGGWDEVGEGHSRCSVKDRYDWRFGIKASLKAAIAAAGIEQDGPVLFAYYSELPKRPEPAKEEGVAGPEQSA